MASDNGGAGWVDFYDVYAALEYLERKYDGTVEINISSAAPGKRGRMLLCASFVGNDSVRPRGAGIAAEISFRPGALREVPRVAHELLLQMQEEIDSLSQGIVVLGNRIVD